MASLPHAGRIFPIEEVPRVSVSVLSLSHQGSGLGVFFVFRVFDSSGWGCLTIWRGG